MTSSIKTTISYTFPSRRKSNKVLIAPLEFIMNKFKLQNFQNHESGKNSTTQRPQSSKRKIG